MTRSTPASLPGIAQARYGRAAGHDPMLAALPGARAGAATCHVACRLQPREWPKWFIWWEVERPRCKGAAEEQQRQRPYNPLCRVASIWPTDVGEKVEERNSVADSPGRDTASTLPEAFALQVETGFVLARHRSVEAAWTYHRSARPQDAALADALRRTPAPEAPRIVDARKDAHAGSLRRGRQANESGRYSASLIVAGAPTISTIASSSLPFTSCTGRQEVRRSGLSARGLFRHVYVRARSCGRRTFAVPCTLAGVSRSGGGARDGGSRARRRLGEPDHPASG